ncbi:hypothetical protein HanIR_Chr04g0151551 [Helianthus annuus]|nr:hypothetical protein HanIR_Chr04g0151551 [Helianthus annuus]
MHHCGFKDPEKTVFPVILIIGCWCSWKARNGLKFCNKQIKIEDIIYEVKLVGLLWFQSSSKFKSVS